MGKPRFTLSNRNRNPLMVKDIKPGRLHGKCVDPPELDGDFHNAPSPVLVMGMVNSGTSILTEFIHKCGIFMGRNMDHYESHYFSIFINNCMIMGGNGGWANLPIMSVDDVVSYKPKVKKFIKRGWKYDFMQWGYDGKSRWGFKDPRLCVLLPLYLKIFPNASIVHIVRDSKNVAASLCQKSKLGIDERKDFDFWKNLSIEYNKRVKKLSGSCNEYHMLEYENMCRNKNVVLEDLADYLNVSITEEAQKVRDKIHDNRVDSYRNYSRKKKTGFFKLGKVYKKFKYYSQTFLENWID